MRILFVTASYPYPPASGGALRVYGLLKGLRARGHKLTLLAFHDGEDDPQDSPLAECCHRIITVPPPERTRSDRIRDLILTRVPDIARRLYSEAFAAELQNLLTSKRFDLIQFEAIEVAYYLPLARKYQPDAKICFDTFNAEYVLQRVIAEIDSQDAKNWVAAVYSFVQSRRIKRFEREMCRKADCVIAVSPEDATALRDFRDDRRVFIVPSGIFVNDYVENGEPDLDLRQNALVFTGKMDYRPNVDAMLWFAEAILPLVQEEVPDVHVYVVGQKPHARLEPLRDNPAFTLTGWVDSVKPYLRAADVYIAPLRMGSGTRLKLLEAMASKCAIVATKIAATGLVPEAQKTMIINDRPEMTARAIVHLLRNPQVRHQLGEDAFEQVSRHYDWSVLVPGIIAAYKEIGLG